MIRKIALLLLLVHSFSFSPRAEVRLSGIFSDNMVLQAHKPVRIWGSAAAGETITVFLDKHQLKTIADVAGKWMVEFSPMDYGKAITLIVVGEKNELRLSNILIGEVWLCSGQSNMAMKVNGDGGQVYNYENEVSGANYPKIRSFNVKLNLSAQTGCDVAGKWEVCSPETVSDFSAVAYFFARKVYQETGIPVGIINSSWGGTDIETWISMDTYKSLPASLGERYKDADKYGVEEVLRKNEEKRKAFADAVVNDIGIKEQWYNQELDTEKWKQMVQPQEWSDTELGTFDGVAWFRYDFNIAASDAGQPGNLSLGRVDDNDVTWINGIKVGESQGAGYERMYNVPAGILKKGKNNITVKVVDAIRAGGFTGTKDELYLETKKGKYSLAGDWKYKVALKTDELHYIDVVPNLCYGLLYNAMIDPLTNFSIKGVIWYQGENNVGRAYEYRTLFPVLINDWRTKWKDDFPFYWVQLAAYLPEAEQPPVADTWAELRESQTLTLKIPHTGQAITTDIGDANNIHPKNKQEVGRRLACIALHNDYDRPDIICSGPVFKQMRKKGNRIEIEFDKVAGGLYTTSKYGYIEGFAIAGSDHKFVWANAKLEGRNRVVVYAEEVDNPVAVRYDWASNPDVNLLNSAGLPTVPFRTDDWKLSTEP